jgi:hypothetical protein
MSENRDQFSEQAAAFQKVWTDSMSKMAQAAFTFTPENAPDETIRQIRSGIFQALSHSWEEFMRSPQFLEGMKQWMDSAMNFRKMTNDFLAKARQEMQEPSRDDLDGVLVALRHLETRILDRMEELAAGVEEMKERLAAVEGDKRPAPSASKAAASAPKSASGKKPPKGARKTRGK